MKKEELIYDSRDGKSKIHAIRWVPDGEVIGVIQIIHGMAEHIARYENVAEWFTERGYVVTGDDHLGHGLSATDNLYGYFCENDPATVVVRDVHRLKKITQEKYKGVPYFILGHSMGSFILRNYMFKYGSGINGAIVCGTGSQPKAVIKFGLALAKVQSIFLGSTHKAKLINRMSFGNSDKIEPEHRNDWLCTDPEVVKKYEADPLCGFMFTVNGFQTLFGLIDRLNNENNVKNMPKDLPVKIISGAEDSVGNFGKGVRQVYDQYLSIGMTNVTCTIYDGLRHEILNEPKRFDIYEELLKWIEDNR